jgi:hypothetical protein
LSMTSTVSTDRTPETAIFSISDDQLAISDVPTDNSTVSTNGATIDDLTTPIICVHVP